jgi:hypothetical protein
MPTPHASSLRYGWYVVAVCTAAYLLSFVDRQILSLLVGPIKADLGISDTAFALLHGLPLRFSMQRSACRWRVWPTGPRARR